MALTSNTVTSIHKANPKRNYHKSCNQILNDNYMTAKAFLIHSYLSSKPSDWQIRKCDIARLLGCSERTALKYMSELKVCGHLVMYNETDDNGRFVGNYYQFHELPVDASNEAKVVRMDAKRTKQRAIENLEKKRRNLDQLARELQADESLHRKKVEPIGIDLRAMFSDCFDRLKKLQDGQINANDSEYLELAFKEYVRTCEGTIYAHAAFQWMERALQFRMSGELRTMTINVGKDKRSAAIAANQMAQADYINAQTRELKSHTPKTTEQRLNDIRWADDDNIDF